MSLSPDGYVVCDCDVGFVEGDEGLTSANMDIGEIALSMSGELCKPLYLGDLGAKAVALDMSSTIIGRTCFPSACV